MKRSPLGLAAPLLALVALALILGAVCLGHAAQRAPRARPPHPGTVAHCLVGGLSPGRVVHWEPCQNHTHYGRI